jgi:hypothetical protein
MLRNWANSFSASSVNPLSLSLKVDAITSGVRMSLIEVRPLSSPQSPEFSKQRMASCPDPRWRAAECRHPTGRERMSSPTKWWACPDCLWQVDEGKIKELVYYDLEVVPEKEGGGVFMAVRDGPNRQLTPPDEAIIFNSLQSFLRTAIPQCKRLR